MKYSDDKFEGVTYQRIWTCCGKGLKTRVEWKNGTPRDVPIKCECQITVVEFQIKSRKDDN